MPLSHKWQNIFPLVLIEIIVEKMPNLYWLRFPLLATLFFFNCASAFAQLSQTQKTCYGQITATADQVIAACGNLIAEEAARDPNAAPITTYYEKRASAWVEKRDCSHALSDQDVVANWADKYAESGKGTSNESYNYMRAANAHFQRATILASCSFDFDRAITEYDAAMRNAEAAAPELIRQNYGSLDNRSLIYFDRATAWYNKGNFGKAIDDLNAAMRVIPKEQDQKKVRANILNNRANVWIAAGKYDLAFDDYSEANRLQPKESSFLSGRGRVWRLKGDLTRSLADLDKAVQLNTKNSESLTYTVRGDTYRYLGQFDKAISDYNKALSYEGNFAAALMSRGLTYERMNQLNLARADYQKAVSQGREFEMVESARARLAALDSGAVLPTILITPPVTSPTSIPTREAAVPPAATENPKSAIQNGRRVALVIGNSAYQNVAALLNPEKDAKAIAESLRNIGFETVTLANNQTREQMVNSLRNFANDAEQSDWAMVYYAGHGMEVGGVNYLIPVDAKIAVDRDIQFEAVPLAQVLNAADTAKKIKLVLLDACRDNPFKPRQTAAPEIIAESMSTAGAPITTRSSNGRGLAEVKITGATLVVYAAKDGQVALDGEGGNSPFAVAVVQRLATPGVEINKLFRLVRDDVMEATAGRQEPYTYGSLPGKEDFFFVSK